jgi:hypothetical protein
VNKDHSHRYWNQEGTLVYANRKHGQIRNQSVLLDSGELVCAPYGNWRRVKEKE